MKFGDMARIEERVQSGGWVGDLLDLPGIRVKVRGMANPDFQRMRAEMAKGVEDGVERDPEVVAAEDARLLLETILVDWDGYEDTPFSREAAAEGLKLRLFRNAVWYASTVVAADGRNDLEEVAKNS